MENNNISENKKQKVILVTGSAGAIGTRLCEKLLELGHQVIGIDNYISGRFENTNLLEQKFPDSYMFIRKNANDIGDIIAEMQPSEIYHAASPSSSQKYEMHPFDCIDVNSQAVDHILWAIRNHAPKCKFMFLSASEVYGNPHVSPQTEDYRGSVTCTGVRGIYDNSKRLGETITAEHNRRFGTNTKIARIFKTASPYTDPNESNLINNFIRQGLLGVPYTINGTGEQVRSICHVDDVVNALIALMDVKYHDPVNIGSEQSMSVLDIAKVVHEVVRPEISVHDIKYIFLPAQKDDAYTVVPDLSLAKNLFDLENKCGIRFTIHDIAQSVINSIVENTENTEPVENQ
jgi:nucleoside-diphosphate-sugar epimerase